MAALVVSIRTIQHPGVSQFYSRSSGTNHTDVMLADSSYDYSLSVNEDNGDAWGTANTSCYELLDPDSYFGFNSSARSIPYSYDDAPESVLSAYSNWYSRYHGYVSVIVCISGVVCNALNILVLTQPRMRNSTNWILAALAVADLLTMVSYVPFGIHFYCLYGHEASVRRNAYGWQQFLLFHVNFSVTAHTIAIFLGVFLSAFRYYYVRAAADPRGWMTPAWEMKCVGIGVLSIYSATPFLLLPNYLSLSVQKIDPDAPLNETMYEVTNTGDGSEDQRLELMKVLNFWIHAVVIKLVPSALLSLFGMLLVGEMRRAHRRSMSLRLKMAAVGQNVGLLQIQSSKNTTSSSLTAVPRVNAVAIAAVADRKRRVKQREHNRTTAMLLIVLILFLMTELPQGILALCSLLPGFFESYYVPLGDTMDIVALVNNGINFMLYCSMSRQFRRQFCQLFTCSDHGSAYTSGHLTRAAGASVRS